MVGLNRLNQWSVVNKTSFCAESDGAEKSFCAEIVANVLIASRFTKWILFFFFVAFLSFSLPVFSS